MSAYTPRTQVEQRTRNPVLGSMQTSTTLYTRHLGKCPHDKDRNYHRCGCPIWFQRNRKRWSAETNDWAKALKQAAAIESGERAIAPSTITVPPPSTSISSSAQKNSRTLPKRLTKTATCSHRVPKSNKVCWRGLRSNASGSCDRSPLPHLMRGVTLGSSARTAIP